jgi:hypothetical protein
MQIKTDGNHEYRLDQLRHVMQQTDENTKAGAFDFSTGFTLQMLRNLERALDHPDMTSELAEELSTPSVQIEYWVETEMHVNE